MSKSRACDVTRREDRIELRKQHTEWRFHALLKAGIRECICQCSEYIFFCHRILRNEDFLSSFFFHAIPVCECLYHLIKAVEGWISIQIEESDFFPCMESC